MYLNKMRSYYSGRSSAVTALAIAGAFTASLFGTVPAAHAAPISLTLQSEAQQSVGPQSTSNPCIIAATQCQQPAGLSFTNFVASGNISLYNETSPTYTVSQLESFGLESFNIAIDVNTTQAAGERLLTFEVLVNGNVEYLYNGPTNIGQISNNGNGYADWTLRTVDLSGFASDATVMFHALWDNASDGGESFFLVSTLTPTPHEVVPEPASLALLGGALLGFGILRRRKA